MNNRKNHYLTQNSQSLRNNMTLEERKLWYDFLKELPFTVNRQKVIGRYIVDFYIAKFNIVIEIDGSQHYDGKEAVTDKERDSTLKEEGITVLRYSNRDINLNFKNVCQDILNKIEEDEPAL